MHAIQETKKRLKLKIHLTDLAVKKLSLPDRRQVTYWDDSTPGFGLRLSAKSKSYVVMYGEKRQLKTLGLAGHPGIPCPLTQDSGMFAQCSQKTLEETA
jgi:hypothetical protein